MNSIILYDKMFLIGHQSGNLSAWLPSTEAFLNCSGLLKAHDGPIKKIATKVVSMTNTQFIITCSSDTYLKVFKPDENFKMIFTSSFELVRSSLIIQGNK